MITDELDSMLRGVASAPATRPPLRPGARIGDRYVVEALLGAGGMGTVYRARDDKLGESVALKIVHARLDAAMLRDEVRLAQKVTHPNVCRTFDLEDIAGDQLVKMEYVPGETLAAKLRREQRLPVEEAVRIARAVLAGLGAAHAKQIVHGDLKPGNIMLDGQRVVLMDFGLARLAETPMGGMRGTLGYIAPELVRDRRGDERADLYALGCVVFEMLVGAPVFGTGTAIAISTRHVSEPAPDVRARRKDVPRWLARAVRTLLDKEPQPRRAGAALLASGPGRRRWIAPAVLAAAAAGVATWRLAAHRPWEPRIVDLPQFDENGDTVSLSPDGEWVAFSADRLQVDRFRGYVASWRTGETVPMFADAADVSGLRWSRDGRAIYAQAGGTLVRQPVAGAPPVARGPTQDFGPGQEISECGDDLLIVGLWANGWRVVLRTSAGEQQLFVSEPAAAVTSASCDRSGEHIAIVSGHHWSDAGNDVYLVDRRGNVQRLTDDHVTGSATFTADGRGLVVSRMIDHREQLFELRLDHPHDLHRLLVDDERDVQPDVSADGRLLAFVRDDTSYFPTIQGGSGEVRVITRQKGTFWFLRPVTDDVVVGQFAAHDAWQIVTLHVATGAVVPLAAGYAPFPSRDGKLIYFAGNDATDTLFAVPIAGGTPTVVAKLPGPIVSGNAGPDGLHVAIERASVESAAYRIVEGVVEPEGGPGLVSVAPDGGWRAVTVRKSVTEAELQLVPPGAPLDRPRVRLQVASTHNRWLDDHRIGYCTDDECRIYDVTTDRATDVAKAPAMALMSTFALDGAHILSCQTVGHVTRHVIVNFGDRR